MSVSVISKPALLTDLPEVKVEGEFVYNFFASDERVNETGITYADDAIDQDFNVISTSDITNASSNAYYGRSAKVPRLIKLTITPPSVSSQTTTRATATQREVANNTFARVGLSIIDTGVDKLIFNVLSSSNIPTDQASPDNDVISTLGSSIQPEGYRYASSDYLSKKESSISSLLRGIEQGFSLLPNVCADLINASLNSTKNLYVDELASSLLNTTTAGLEQIQQQASIENPYEIRESNYSIVLEDASRTSGIPTSSANLNNYLVGYVIQKFGIKNDGTTSFFPEKVIKNPSCTFILDPEVAYGSRYKYRVSAIYLCEFNASVTASGEEDGTRVIQSFFTSRGSDVTIDCIEDLAPPPPVDLKFRFRADNTGLNITWNFPINMQLDIKKFQVFRRKTTSESFELLQVYDFDDSVVKSTDPENVPVNLITKSTFPITIHRDTTFTKNSRYIYAICAIDAHGYTSNYSTQLEATYDRYRNRINTRAISNAGAPKPYPNIYLLRDTFIDTMKMSGYTRLNIYFDPEYITIKDDNDNDLDHILFNGSGEDDNSYKLMIVNTDMQKSETLTIEINDSYIVPATVTPSRSRVFSPTNNF